MNKQKFKRYLYYSAVKDIVQLFGEQELGSCEVDDLVVASYVESDKFAFDTFELSTWDKEDVYEYVTNEILNGLPVWQMLKVSDYTKKMLEKSLDVQIAEQRKRLEKKYKCYTCKYFREDDTSLGTFLDCTWTPKPDRYGRTFSLKRRDVLPLQKCKNYEKRDE